MVRRRVYGDVKIFVSAPKEAIGNSCSWILPRRGIVGGTTLLFAVLRLDVAIRKCASKCTGNGWCFIDTQRGRSRWRAVKFLCR